MNVVVSHWSANAAVLAVVAALAAVHARGLRGVAVDARRQGEDPPRGMGWEAMAFYGGLLVVVLALLSPLAYWSARYIWVRSVQDVLLANVAPALLVLGAPWFVLRRGLPLRWSPAGGAGRPAAADTARRPAGRRGRPTEAADTARRPAGRRGRPTEAADIAPCPAGSKIRLAVGTVIAFNVAWCAWHLPVLYDGALRYPVVYAAEAVSYLGLGVALWLVLIGSRPLSPVLPPLRRAMLLAGTVVVGTVLGMVLVFGYGVAYPSYLRAGQHLVSVVYDQQTGGAVLWMLVLPAYVTAGVALLIRWLKDEEAQAMASGLDRLLKPAKQAWPSRTGLRGS